jgi:hypothetical protein
MENKVLQFFLAEKQWSNWTVNDFGQLDSSLFIQASCTVAAETITTKRQNTDLENVCK